MTVTEDRNTGPLTYGGPTLDRPPQFGLTRQLGPVGTALVFGGMALVALLIRVSLFAAIVVVAVDGLALAVLSIRDTHHRNGLTRIATRAGWWRTRHRRAHVYRAGPYGQIPHGHCQLPGVAAQTTLTEWRDSYDRPFALVTVPSTDDHTVVLTTDPDGAALVDQEAIDVKVARYSLLLGRLGSLPKLVGASVIVETAPDSGTRLRREVETNADADASPIAQAMLSEIVQTYQIQSYTVRDCVTMTFSGAGPEGRRSPDRVGRDLATRLPGLVGALNGTGAGAVRPATAADVAETVHTAYDPAAARAFDAARAMGEPLVVPWEDVGPSATQAGWEAYRHDAGMSVTYEVTGMPPGPFRETLLVDLLAPHPDIDRKRVAVLYRPLSPAAATRAVDAAVNNAERRAKRPRSTGTDKKVKRAADQVAAEVADGAGLLNFSILITVTVTDPSRLVQARAAVEASCAAARLTVRPVYGSQDSAFAFALPLGLVPSRHLRVPSELRAAL